MRGLDALPEVALHPILRSAFEGAGLGTYAERPFPGEPERRPRHAERERCDLVLTRDPKGRLFDPLEELVERDRAAGGLFDPAMLEERGIAPAGVQGAIDPRDAFWLEVKTVGQHTYTAGVPGPNRSYAAELLSGPAEDAIKLEWDAVIRHCGVLVILFTEDERTADHDFGVVMHRLLDREIPVGSPLLRKFAIPDMIGNRVCAAALIPVVKT